ncbi:MAG TPA: hypothetical protein VE548_01155 [Nitrososphaeraceae archaeon]|nr:hypothetical protein [Nitrososphaeraceae archaeon]
MMCTCRPRTLQTSIKSFSRFILLALLITSSLFLLAASIGNAYSQNNNNWFVGKGAQENTYYTYKVQHHDVNQGRPFLMTVYLKEFNEEGQYWIAPVFVVDQGKVVNGTFHLSALDMSALGSSDIPADMAPYRSGYSRSLQWLASFVPKPGQSLTAPYWGKIAAIGGEAIAPRGNAKVTVSAGTFDTIVVKWHKGVDNNIWINPNMPYPVKAETFADVTTGNPPVQYTFELQATGKGQPPSPKSQLEIPKPPLTIQTARGTYFIRLLWTPPINPGTPEEFEVLFMDNSQNVLNQVNYGFKVTSSTNDTVIEDLRNQKARDGTGVQTVEFPGPGSYTIEVNVEAVAGSPMGMFVESAKYGVVVE